MAVKGVAILKRIEQNRIYDGDSENEIRVRFPVLSMAQISVISTEQIIPWLPEKGAYSFVGYLGRTNRMTSPGSAPNRLMPVSTFKCILAVFLIPAAAAEMPSIC